MKFDGLNEGTLYLIKRHDDTYIIAHPLYDMDDKLCGWWDQKCVSQVHYEDDIVIGSLNGIERNYKE